MFMYFKARTGRRKEGGLAIKECKGLGAYTAKIRSTITLSDFSPPLHGRDTLDDNIE